MIILGITCDRFIKMKNRHMKNKTLIIVISTALPLAVAILFNVKIPNVEPLNFLPPIYAGINSITVFTLIFAVIAIKKAIENSMKF